MMGKARYVVNLTKDEVEYLEGLVSKGKRSARLITRARVLLKTAAGGKDPEIVGALGVSERRVYTTRKACVEGGVDAALHDLPRPGKKPKLADQQSAGHCCRARPTRSDRRYATGCEKYAAFHRQSESTGLEPRTFRPVPK